MARNRFEQIQHGRIEPVGKDCSGIDIKRRQDEQPPRTFVGMDSISSVSEGRETVSRSLEAPEEGVILIACGYDQCITEI